MLKVLEVPKVGLLSKVIKILACVRNKTDAKTTGARVIESGEKKLRESCDMSKE